MSYEPKSLKPSHICVIQLHVEGKTNREIAAAMDYSEQTVSNIINSSQGQSMIAAVCEESVDTMGQVRSFLQAHAPWLAEELVKEAISSPDLKVRHQAKVAALGMAGHIKTVNVNLNTSHSDHKYEGMSEAELRQEIYGHRAPKSNNPNDPLVGPDGKPLQ
jgi:transposase